MVRSNTLVFCIVILAMTTTYCTGWLRQQGNQGINLAMERRFTKREFQHQLFGEVDASRRLPRAVPVRHPIDEPEPEKDPVPVRRPPAKPTCPCPCGPGSYNVCPAGCVHSCYDCPCPCGVRGYNGCPAGCRSRSTCSVL